MIRLLLDKGELVARIGDITFSSFYNQSPQHLTAKKKKKKTSIPTRKNIHPCFSASNRKSQRTQNKKKKKKEKESSKALSISAKRNKNHSHEE